MESNDDFESFSPTEAPSSPIPDRKLKRLKKAKTLLRNSPKSETLGSEETKAQHFQESELETIDLQKSTNQDFEEPELETLDLQKSTSLDSEESDSRSERFENKNGSDSSGDGLGIEKHFSGAKRTLDFYSVAEELHGSGEHRFDDMEMEKETQDLRVEESAKKRQNNGGSEESEDKKKKVRRVSDDEKPDFSRRTEKERREQLKQLRAESQRLLRETRDAAFKSVPLVQKPISSVLEKIRQRKLEVSKKSVKLRKTSFVDYDEDDFPGELLVNVDFENAHIEDRGEDKATKVASEGAVPCPAKVEGALGVLFEDPSKNTTNHSSHEIIQTQMAVDEEHKPTFRAPINDTQDLFSESQTIGSKDELPDETPNSPLEEVLAPSLLAMNLKLGSAPSHDVSSDEEDNDKENINPALQKLDDLSSSPNGDPVKAFVDDEAEEEDDSDNDLFRFEDNEEDEDIEDAEELKDMIAAEYKEKPIDTEKRNELHQKWLEQQDAAGTEKLLQRFKHGSKEIETPLLEEEDDEESEEDNEISDEDTEDVAPTNVRLNLRKVKEMISQMFTDKDDAYISSDDEETEKSIAKQCLFEKSEEKATFLSPAEDKDSKEVFSLIKKLNIVPDSRKRTKTTALSEMRLIGVSRAVSSKSSFLGRGSNHSLALPQKRGSSMVRSFIFERDDSNSRGASFSEGSSDTIQMENRPTKTASTRLYSSQIKSTAQNAKAAAEKGTALFEILRRPSVKSSRCTQDSVVSHTESVLATFRLEKPMKKEPDMSIRTL